MLVLESLILAVMSMGSVVCVRLAIVSIVSTATSVVCMIVIFARLVALAIVMIFLKRIAPAEVVRSVIVEFVMLFYLLQLFFKLIKQRVQ